MSIRTLHSQLLKFHFMIFLAKGSSPCRCQCQDFTVLLFLMLKLKNMTLSSEAKKNYFRDTHKDDRHGVLTTKNVCNSAD